QHGASEGLTLQAARIDHRSDVRNRRELENLIVTRLDIDFHFGEADRVGLRLPVAWIAVFRHGNEALSRQPRKRTLRERVDVLGPFVSVVLATELDRLPRRLSERHAPAAAVDPFVTHLVALG